MFSFFVVALFALACSHADAACSGTGFIDNGDGNCVCDTANKFVGETACGKLSVTNGVLSRSTTDWQCPEGHLDLSTFTDVTEIAAETFASCTVITSVQFPSTLERLKQYSFYLTGLQGPLDLSGTSLSTIETGSFGSCPGITSIKFPSTILSIYSKFFGTNSNIESVDFSLAENAVSILLHAFGHSNTEDIIFRFSKDNNNQYSQSYEIKGKGYDDSTFITVDCENGYTSDSFGGCCATGEVFDWLQNKYGVPDEEYRCRACTSIIGKVRTDKGCACDETNGYTKWYGDDRMEDCECNIATHDVLSDGSCAPKCAADEVREGRDCVCNSNIGFIDGNDGNCICNTATHDALSDGSCAPKCAANKVREGAECVCNEEDGFTDDGTGGCKNICRNTLSDGELLARLAVRQGCPAEYSTDSSNYIIRNMWSY